MSKFYNKIRAGFLLGRRMTSKQKCPSPADKGKKTEQGKIVLEKPKMRNLHLDQTMRNLYIAIGLTVISCGAFYFLHNLPRRQAYENFYANYDPQAAFERMKAAGYLNSCPPEPEPRQRNCLLNLLKDKD